MIFAGPGLGLVLGQMCASGLVLYAALQKPDLPIEVARATDGRHRILVVATEPVEGQAVDRVALAAEASPSEDPAIVMVLAPARTAALSEWLSDLEPARDRAQVLLVHSAAALAATGVDAQARVGDADLIQAIEDTLRSFPASELITVTGDPQSDRGTAKALEELERRLPVPVAHATAASLVVGVPSPV
jgi:hypothetical protein